MDTRFRRLQRSHAQEPSDIQTHARLLSSAIRSGFLNFHHVLLCAFLGHHAARLTMINEAKHDGVIYNGKKIPNMEITHLIGNIPQWGREPARRAGLAVTRMCIEHLKSVGQTGSFYTLAIQGADEAERVIKHDTPDKELWAIIRRIQGQRASPMPTRREKVGACERMIANFLIDCAASGKHTGLLKASTAWFDDNKLEAAVRAELYPWALGEYI